MRNNQMYPKRANIIIPYQLFLSLIIFILSLSHSSLSKHTISLADKGQAKFNIIQTGQASQDVKKAVSELAHHLQHISGAQFIIRNHKSELPAIIVGTKNQSIFNGNFSHLQTRDSFTIKTKRDAKRLAIRIRNKIKLTVRKPSRRGAASRRGTTSRRDVVGVLTAIVPPKIIAECGRDARGPYDE